MTVLKLTDTMRKRIPEGKFDPLWAQSALQPPPPLGKNPHYKDVVAHRQLEDVISSPTGKPPIERSKLSEMSGGATPIMSSLQSSSIA